MTSRIFISYSRSDNTYEEGELRRFRDALSRTVQFVSGTEVSIFQEDTDIGIGEHEQARISQSLNEAMVLIPIITPSFFTDPNCRTILERFLERERSLGRDDLVLPIYYQQVRELEEAKQSLPQGRLPDDALLSSIAQRRMLDWRPWRGKEFGNREVREELERLAQRITELLDTLTDPEASPTGTAGLPAEPPPATEPPPAPQSRRIREEIEKHPVITAFVGTLVLGLCGVLAAVVTGVFGLLDNPTPASTPMAAQSTPSPTISCTYDGADAASYYHKQGMQAREEGNRTEAINAFECALQAEPEQTPTMYQLARTYEDMGNDALATDYYQQAANLGFAPAANELLYRLLVTTLEGAGLSEEQRDAAGRYDSYLQEALNRNTDDISPEMQFIFYKNRGWHAFVRGSTMFDVARHQLDQAIDLFEARRAHVGDDAFDTLPRASPYCLRAQIYQQQGRDTEEIDAAWRACCRWANTEREEEAIWRSQGQSYFAAKGESCLFPE